MTGSLFSQVVEYALARGKRNLKNAARMTKREKEVIAAIMEGMSNKQMVRFAAGGLAGGLYFSKLEAGGRIQTRPLLLAR